MQQSYLQSLFGLDGKTIMVTGAAGGIGSAISKGLAMAGAEVALCGRTVSKCQALEADIAALDEELIRPEYSTDAARLTELSVAREEKETALNEAMEQWETLAEQLEGQPESQTESQPVGQN